MKKTNQTKCVTEVFSRVCGFFRPIQAWNKGKVSEYKDRQNYKAPKGKYE